MAVPRLLAYLKVIGEKGSSYTVSRFLTDLTIRVTNTISYQRHRWLFNRLKRYPE